MIIVNIIGGLGNQMFQYAFYKNFKSKQLDVKVDLSSFKGYKLHNGFELSNIFNIEIDVAGSKEINKLSDNNNDFCSKLRRKVLGRKDSHYIQKDFGFIQGLSNLDNVYFDGYWQSEKYFEDIKSIIREDFSFKEVLEGKNEEIASIMKKTNSVSLHVRRGDYVSDKKAAKVHGGVTTLEYYKRALNIIYDKIDNPVFFVFSDDIQWAKEHLPVKEAIFIDWNKNENSYKDMQLMSICKNNIIANSSFSWWGAWLNDNPSKIVVAPDKWFNDSTFNTSDVIPKEWIKCSTKS